VGRPDRESGRPREASCRCFHARLSHKPHDGALRYGPRTTQRFPRGSNHSEQVLDGPQMPLHESVSETVVSRSSALRFMRQPHAIGTVARICWTPRRELASVCRHVGGYSTSAGAPPLLLRLTEEHSPKAPGRRLLELVPCDSAELDRADFRFHPRPRLQASRRRASSPSGRVRGPACWVVSAPLIGAIGAASASRSRSGRAAPPIKHTHAPASISALARGTIGALTFVAERQPERLLATSAERAEQAGRGGRRRGRVALRPATSLMATAWLLLSESGSFAGSPEPSRECCWFVIGEAPDASAASLVLLTCGTACRQCRILGRKEQCGERSRASTVRALRCGRGSGTRPRGPGLHLRARRSPRLEADFVTNACGV